MFQSCFSLKLEITCFDNFLKEKRFCLYKIKTIITNKGVIWSFIFLIWSFKGRTILSNLSPLEVGFI